MTRLRRLLRPARISYAVGELLLIIAGILIALWLSDWDERRGDRKLERRLLADMRASLVHDTAELAIAVKRFRIHRDALGQLDAAIAAKQPYTPRMDSLFGRSYWNVAIVRPRTAAFDVLKDRGFEIVEDDTLRNYITTLYGDTYDDVAWANESIQSALYTVLRPYFLMHFKVDPGTIAVPLSYDAVMRDPYFDNIIKYRKANSLNGLRADSSALDLARKTIARINLVLADE